MRSILACFCVWIVGLSPVQTPPSTTVERSTPEKTVQSFVTAFQKGLVEDAMSCVLDFKVTDVTRKRAAQLSGIKFTLKSVVSDVKITGIKASAKVNTTFTVGETEPKQYSETVQFALNKGNWLIVQPKTSPEGKTFINMTIYALGFDDTIKESEKKPELACVSNLRQIAAAFEKLAQDNEGIYKVAADSWKKPIMPYLKDESFLKCPLDTGGPVSYSINPAIAGKKVSDFKYPKVTVLLYEGKSMKIAFRHNKMAAIAFIDGHVELVDLERAKKLRLQP